MKIKISKTTKPQLNWLVARCEGEGTPYIGKDGKHCLAVCDYSSDWSAGGPIIEREFIHLLGWRTKSGDRRVAQLDTETGSFTGLGPTPLIAAMRCYVASKLGAEVEMPDELC